MADEKRFTFQVVDGKIFSTFESNAVKELLMKWGMIGSMKVQMFAYDQLFQQYEKDKFFQDFFQDSAVMSSLKVLSKSGSWCPLGIKATNVNVEAVSCSIINMSFFDRLTTIGVVRESGNIVKCFDEFYEDIVISDELRKLLLLEESDNFEVFHEAEREEFIFRIFKHLCLGGQVCQYEDNIKPYLDTSKAIYKELVSVQKDPNTKELQVGSWVFKVTAFVEGKEIYPSSDPHEQTFAYMIIQPVKRNIYVWYNTWKM